MGRPTKYDWDDKKDICYQLFVEQKKSPRDILRFFANHFGVPKSQLPSEKVLSRQITNKWGFPKRKPELSAPAEAALVARTRELWEQNVSFRDIRSTLAGEGCEIAEYDFAKLRRKHGFHRRGEGSFKTESVRKRKGADGDGENGEPEAGEDPDSPMQDEDAVTGEVEEQAPALSPEEAARRAQRLVEIQLTSDQRLQTRKRRRRIRGFGHLPPDAPGLEPRYGSETSLDECKAFLQLSNEMYMTIRQDFELVCVDMDIDRKKTSLEDGRWQASKDRLVRDNMHLSAVMHPLQPGQDKKAIALDCICADVTKRMRDSKKQMTIGDANNVLGLNPMGSKDIRRLFYEILERDQYTTRLACGDEHWQELRDLWYATSPLLQEAVASGDKVKMRAMDILSRDACKRYNDDKIRLDPSRKQYQRQYYGPGPGAAKHKGSGPTLKSTAPKRAAAGTVSEPSAEEALAATLGSTYGNSAIATQPPIIDYHSALDPALQNGYVATPQPAPPPTAYMAPRPPPAPPQPARAPTSAYFRLSPASQLVGNHPRMWLGKLMLPTLTSLRNSATSKAGAAKCSKVHGIVKNVDGSEDSYQIDGDDELAVYLDAAGEKATFVVLLEGGYA